MTQGPARVVYKPDSKDAYIVLVNPEEYNKWKEDSTTPLVDVVQTFDIYHSGQGPQGKLGTPSKQQLDTVFGTDEGDEDEGEKGERKKTEGQKTEDRIILVILQKGKIQAGDGITGGGGGGGNKNVTRGSEVVDRGRGLNGI